VTCGVGEMVGAIKGIFVCVSTTVALTVDIAVSIRSVGFTVVGVAVKRLQDTNNTTTRNSRIIDLLMNFIFSVLFLNEVPNELRVDAAEGSEAEKGGDGAAASFRSGVSRTREGAYLGFGI
jgi:hypothetical protein